MDTKRIRYHFGKHGVLFRLCQFHLGGWVGLLREAHSGGALPRPSKACGMKAARRGKATVPLARKERGASATGPERIRRRDATGAANTACRVTGGISTKTCKPYSRMDGASRRQGESAVAEWRGTEDRSAPTCNGGEERARQLSGLRADGERRSGRLRRQSRDCRGGWTRVISAPARG